MTTDVITAKLEREFDSKDADQDGYLDWSDYQKLVDRYIEAYKIDKNDRRARGLQAAYQMYWLELLRHSGANSDRLTKDQFVMANRFAVVDTSRINVADGLGHATFDVIDLDGDNMIGKNEFDRLMRDVWKTDAPEAMDVFVQLDTDGDGEISRQEYLRAIREYYFSSEPGALGSLLMRSL
ncbi:EF-hand domain-containing protein [Streptomyces sp. NPDC004788]